MTIMIARKIDADNDYVNKEMEFRINFFENWKTINSQTKVVSSYKIQWMLACCAHHSSLIGVKIMIIYVSWRIHSLY